MSLIDNRKKTGQKSNKFKQYSINLSVSSYNPFASQAAVLHQS